MKMGGSGLQTKGVASVPIRDNGEEKEVESICKCVHVLCVRMCMWCVHVCACMVCACGVCMCGVCMCGVCVHVVCVHQTSSFPVH